MSTKAQINANRQNAKKSTGPQTTEGKAATSQNAFKHGLFLKKAVVKGESQEEYELHRRGLLAEWQPAGVTESIVAERLVNLTWRLERAQRMQNQIIDYLGINELRGYRARILANATRRHTAYPCRRRASQPTICCWAAWLWWIGPIAGSSIE